jgi:class 3 adenylate cyclase
VTFHWLSRAQDWIVGIVVPEDYYVRDLVVLRDRFLVAYGTVTLLIRTGGLLALRALRRGLGLVHDATSQMRRFLTSAIAASGGTVDKYIGDSIMAFWNAPTIRPGHPALACRARLPGGSTISLRLGRVVRIASSHWLVSTPRGRSIFRATRRSSCVSRTR